MHRVCIVTYSSNTLTISQYCKAILNNDGQATVAFLIPSSSLLLVGGYLID